jgi:hypothetical protein
LSLPRAAMIASRARREEHTRWPAVARTYKYCDLDAPTNSPDAVIVQQFSRSDGSQ